ncbi:MAG: dihydrofolate reductase [Sporocytophaga sp.]|uniref:dihydrofolate reductase n=1 Tax=Sporocytophaga sp. TaxID=2231183 RepID=UPI001B2CFE74|nr:dihydrofolate reductase [Sporocytophaga sp.]MBO9700512.1 dihydrofolate reductase [Sporocytophaga sp.]
MLKSIIVAVSANDVIGYENKLPWHLPADLKYFKNLTMGHHVIMGRKTYESIGKILPGRIFIIVTRDKNYMVPGATVVHSIENAFEYCSKNNESEAFIIGGADIINQSERFADKLYLTRIHEDFVGDVYLQFNMALWKEESKQDFTSDEKNKYPYSFLVYNKK